MPIGGKDAFLSKVTFRRESNWYSKTKQELKDMARINLKMTIDYDRVDKTIDKYDIDGKYSAGEIAVIIATFKHCLKDWGYEVKRVEE